MHPVDRSIDAVDLDSIDRSIDRSVGRPRAMSSFLRHVTSSSSVVRRTRAWRDVDGRRNERTTTRGRVRGSVRTRDVVHIDRDSTNASTVGVGRRSVDAFVESPRDVDGGGPGRR